MGSTLKVFHALSILSAVVPSVNAVPSGTKLELKAFKNIDKHVYKRQDLAGLVDTCNLCPVIRRLAPYIPQDVQSNANAINNQVRDLIASVGPTLPGGIPALDSLLANPIPGVGALLNGAVPSALPTDILGAVPSAVGDLLNGALTSLPDLTGLPDLPLPTDAILGAVPPVDDLLNGVLTGLPALPLPTDPVLGADPSVAGDLLNGGLTGLPLPTDDVLGAVTNILGSALPLPTDVLGAVPDVLENPLGAVQSDVLGAVTDILGSALPLPTDLGAVTDVLENPLGAVQSDVLGAVTDILGSALPLPTDLGAVTDILGSALPLPTDLGAVTDILDDPLGAVQSDVLGAVPSALGGLLNGGSTNFPNLTGLPNLPLATDAVLGAVPSAVGDLLANPLGPLPTDALAPATNLLGGLLGGVPAATPATNPLGGLLPPGPTAANPLGDLLGGVLAPTAATKPLGALGGLLGGAVSAPTAAVGNILGAVTSAVAPAATGGLSLPVTNPRIPRVIQSGTVVDKSYDWTFYNNGAVQVDRNFLFPRQGVLSGLLPDRTFSGLFADGLHIGDHIVPFPPAFLPLLAGLNLPLLPPSLLSGVIPDDARK